MDDINELQHKVKQIKRKCLDICVNAGLGHVTTAFSCAEIVTALFYNVMNYDPSDPSWDGRDRFIMSKNHGSVIMYPILADLGWINEDLLMTFMGDGSILGGHSKIDVPGIDFSGGSLGIGLGFACGLAYGAKLYGQKHRIYCLVGDGESYEGSIWEAAMFAGHNKLDNLTVIVDRNNMACTDFTEKMLCLEPYSDKWSSFNFNVKEIDGHNIGEIISTLNETKNNTAGKPVCIIAKTVKGHGIDFMCNDPLMHGVAPKGEKIQLAYHELEKEYDQ